MEQYKNLGGNSGIEAYEIAADSITVRFTSGRKRHYLYSYVTPGRDHVEEMKRLALAGKGLNAYIKTNKDVRDGYANKR